MKISTKLHEKVTRVTCADGVKENQIQMLHHSLAEWCLEK
ncbi:hypothetical protein ymoll0001_20900 [Yersinia mollaretii ATCC 43969]|uniref:Uncharacterized protein n=1 Tax=Yersinia mollaretii (strain ATCC 43969 / DSM 18520 / CIP 103324 / CNY 7263 / WAIP 204) TaxID=349967 RepID=A0ABP2EKK8_YERMW|nr:hypothetical protein ymoll0001_20900 [Yersinia mollaretii ATCC 43969]